jgi:hypothetical protein
MWLRSGMRLCSGRIPGCVSENIARRNAGFPSAAMRIGTGVRGAARMDAARSPPLPVEFDFNDRALRACIRGARGGLKSVTGGHQRS